MASATNGALVGIPDTWVLCQVSTFNMYYYFRHAKFSNEGQDMLLFYKIEEDGARLTSNLLDIAVIKAFKQLQMSIVPT